MIIAMYSMYNGLELVYLSVHEISHVISTDFCSFV